MHSEFDLTTQEYVEIIHELQKSSDSARVRDIARMRGVTLSSVSTALNLLRKKELVVHSTYGRVELTHQGTVLAQELEKHHEVIQRFLIQILGIHPDTADSEACKIEHYISEETVEALVNLIGFIGHCPYGKAEWLQKYFQFGPLMQGDLPCPFFKSQRAENLSSDL